MANTSTIKPQFVDTPPNYPAYPQSGKLESLLLYNEKNIYRKFSPYTNNTDLLGFGSRQPYVWYYPDEGKKGLNVLGKISGRGLPFAQGLQDVVRISKFITSGRGVLFLAKQFLLQGFQPFNETKIYNPLETIIATARGVTLGVLQRPQRHVDTSGGVTGVLASILGFNSDSKTSQPPKGTTGAMNSPQTVLSVMNQSSGKGLLRGQTAQSALSRRDKVWDTTGQTSKGGFFSTIANRIKDDLRTLGQGLLPTSNPSYVTYRADEGTYGKMLADKNKLLSYYDTLGSMKEISQPWFAGSNGGKLSIRKESEIPNLSARLKNFVDENGVLIPVNIVGGLMGEMLFGNETGYSVDVDPLTSLVTYGYNVGQQKIKLRGEYEGYKYSDMLVQFSYYINPNRKYASKFIDRASVQNTKINENLQKIITNLQNSGYAVDLINNTRAIGNPSDTIVGYNKISNASGNDNGYENEYKSRTRVIDGYRTAAWTYKFGGANRRDGINLLDVLNGDRKVSDLAAEDYYGWTEWKPYEDDIVAFYFHDLVNDKYIPFRSTIENLSEGNSALWEELKFLSRPDSLYSYTGFVRTLSFSFTVAVGSIKELLPTWKKIVYLEGLTKPSNYITAKTGDITNNFMVSPMVALTVGDMYKEQPIVLSSIGLSVPKDTPWETSPEIDDKDWTYLNKQIRWENSKGKYGQLPMMVDISIACNILERERALVGNGHFGDAMFGDDYINGNQTGGKMSKNLVTYVGK